MTKEEFEKLESENKLKAIDQDNSPEGVLKLLKIDQIEVELGYRLVSLVDKTKGGDLMDRIGQIRRQVMMDLGLPLPAIRVHDNLQVASNDYQVKLKGAVIAKGSVEPDCFLAVNTGLVDLEAETITGKETKEPSYGLPAIWISDTDRERAETQGYTIASPSAVLATHLTEILRSHAGEILSRQDLHRMMEQVKQQNEVLAKEIEEALSGGELLTLLQNLLREKVSIRDLQTILEITMNYTKINKDPDFLSEKVREGMGRQICSEYLVADILNATTFHPSVEEEIINSLHMGKIALEPSKLKVIIEKLQKAFVFMSEQGLPAVILCSAKIRSSLRKIIERSNPQMAVLSYSEVPATITAQSISMIAWD